MIRAAIGLALAGLAGSAVAQERSDPLARALGGRIAGPPVACVDHARLGSGEVIDERTILYRESRGRIWRNNLPEPCRGLRPLSTLVIDAFGAKTCRDDHFRVLEPGSRIPTAYCRFGAFTPYDEAAR